MGRVNYGPYIFDEKVRLISHSDILFLIILLYTHDLVSLQSWLYIPN